MADESLVPPPPVVREQLAESLEESKLLRRLLRLSERFAERRHRRQAQLGGRDPERDRGTECQ